MNKFYGISKFNNRGQIVIPIEARQDFNFLPSENLVLLKGILPHSKDAFLLIKSEIWYQLPADSKIKDTTKHEFVGIIKIAERGQVVIPKIIRDQLNIKAGMQVLILSHEKTSAIIIALLNEQRVGDWATNIIA